MNEISYRTYAENGEITEEITFDEFVKYYINHRPAFGISLRQLQDAFQTFADPGRRPSSGTENPVLTRDQFLNVLLGKGPVDQPPYRSKGFGEPFTPQEAYAYPKLLLGCGDNDDDRDKEKRNLRRKRHFLPERISYKEFITDIMGIELSEETRADDE
nr:uncharacterized protein LOC117222741 [Megalopta genalis]